MSNFDRWSQGMAGMNMYILLFYMDVIIIHVHDSKLV